MPTIDELAQLRATKDETARHLAELDAEVMTRRESLQQKILDLEEQWRNENAELLAEQDAARQAAEQSEAELREATVDAFRQYGNSPALKALGLSGRKTVKLEYDAQKAVEWARVNAPYCLTVSLDKKAFEAIPADRRPDFVTETEIATAVIAKEKR